MSISFTTNQHLPPSTPTQPPQLHLSNNVDDILPQIFSANHPGRHYPNDFIAKVKLISSRKSKTPRKSSLRFDVSQEAAEHNAKQLAQYDYDVSRLISDNQNSIISYGSEFREPPLLHLLLRDHPLWGFLRKTLERGAEFEFTSEQSDEARILENSALIDYGNHKSAKDNDDVISKSLKSEVNYGFACVLPVETVNRIRHSMVVPLGIADQFTIDADGNRIPKRRLTHDQTYHHLETGKSSNDLTDRDKLPPLIYGHCIVRILHHIVSLRLHFPGQIIFINKYDFSKAYRRIQYSGRGAAQCIAIHDNLAYLEMRLSFGGSGCPPTWCTASEIATDLANDLILCCDWSPKICQSPVQQLVPPPNRLPLSIPFGTALPLALEPPACPEGKVDCFVDDVTTVFLDTPENCVRTPAAVPLAIHILNRPLASDEPIPRELFLALDKLKAEGGPSEQGILLGWSICTRTLRIGLPEDKHQAWSLDVQTVINQGTVTFDALESIIGRLENAAMIIPHARYFLNRIRGLLHRRARFQKVAKLTASTTADLHLWLSFLTQARSMISMNLLTTRRPTHILFSDACPGGLGGYSITTGQAWRHKINPSTTNPKVSNNLLEFIGSVVQIWLTVGFDPTCQPHSCLLAWTDSSSGAGWLHKSNFDEHDEDLHDNVARHLARTLIQSSCMLFPQHIQGKQNSVADALSRRFDLSNLQLQSHILSSFPEQVPKNLLIVPLPNEISSWISSTTTLKTESSIQKPKGHTRNTTALGTAGPSSSKKSVSFMTPLSTSLPRPSGPKFVPLSSSVANEDTSPTPNADNNWTENLRLRYSAGLSKKPLGTWLRNSGVLGGLAPFTTMSAPTNCCPT